MKITLKAARVNAGYTQTEAGNIVGVNRNTIVKWENGQSVPDVISFRKLCDAYHVSEEAVIFLPNG